MSEWISTKQAMSLLGVGSTTIKRWADEGRIPYYKTAGGHRRFRRGAIERLSEIGGSTPETPGSEIVEWTDLVLNGDVADIARRLREELERDRDPFGLADLLGSVMREVNESWAGGDCSTIEEFMAAIRTAQAIDALIADTAPNPSGTSALVVTAAGERHSLGAHLAQFCLRYHGVPTQLLDVDVLPEQINEHLRGSGVRLVAMSASAWYSDDLALKRYVRRVGGVCNELGIHLVIGGSGAWPADPEYGHRCMTFKGLKALLDNKTWLH